MIGKNTFIFIFARLFVCLFVCLFSFQKFIGNSYLDMQWKGNI